MKHYTIPFREITAEQRRSVGEKNFSVGELMNHLSPLGINVPDGFAVVADAYVDFLQSNYLFPLLQNALNEINCVTFENVKQISSHCRDSIMRGSFPKPMESEIRKKYAELVLSHGFNTTVAVRSSGTTRHEKVFDFSGQYDTFLNVNGADHLMNAIKQCYASMFNERALRYRFDECCNDLLSGISIGIQFMVRSDKGSAGVAYTFDARSENEKLIYITGSWGLGQGELHNRVDADEFYLSKPALKLGNPCIVLNVKGMKEEMLVSGELQLTEWIRTSDHLRNKPVLANSELELLGLWCLAIEKHYGQPIDIEWAKDGEEEKLYVVQARVQIHETRHAKGSVSPAKEKTRPTLAPDNDQFSDYQLTDLEVLHRQSSEWLQQISFMKDEIIFMQKLLGSILHISLSTTKTDCFATELTQLKDLHIQGIHHLIIEHERWLSDILRTDTIGRQVAYREIHTELSVKMATYYRTFLSLRHDILMLANNYLKKNVRI